MHQDSTGRVHSGIASQISFAVGNALRNPDQFRSVPLIGELGRVVKHENKIVRCRYTLTRGLEMARQNVSFADAMIGKKTVGRLRVRPILANERNTLPYVAADPLKQCAKSLAKPRIPKLAPGDFTINPRCCKTGDSIIVPVRAVTQRQAHGAPSLPNQVLSNKSQRILPIQVFISRSTPQTHPELWVIERFRVGIHLGDVVEESDGDLMGDGVNIAARLEGIAKPGAICLSEDAYRQVKSRLNLAVSDLGPTQLKNIAEPVRVYALEVGKQAEVKPKSAAPEQRSIFALFGAGIVALIAVAGGAWYFLGANRPATVTSNVSAARSDAAHLSIVVLPFRNLSGDPSQDYFADGITENLTTDLSRIRNSFVIARNTAFTFKGKNIDTKEISKEPGVRYVLEGSVQRDQNHVRVNAQLIDGETGAHLWADRFEESITDLFKLQDQVVARLANTLGTSRCCTSCGNAVVTERRTLSGARTNIT